MWRKETSSSATYVSANEYKNEDESRREVTFNLGDEVLLGTKNIVLK